MPDKRQHRGPNPEDFSNFSAEAIPSLRAAVADLSWLLTHRYADKSALKLVGDRFSLTERQRIAVRRCACADQALQSRHDRRIAIDQVSGKRVLLDGFNILTTIEAALGKGVVLIGRDQCCRDMASMHGSFKKVEETPGAIRFVGQTLERLRAEAAVWYLDQPVSNSGRLKQMITAVAETYGWNWKVELVPDPDPVLAQFNEVIASADSGVLDRCGLWLNLAREVVREHAPDAWYVPLGGNES